MEFRNFRSQTASQEKNLVKLNSKNLTKAKTKSFLFELQETKKLGFTLDLNNVFDQINSIFHRYFVSQKTEAQKSVINKILFYFQKEENNFQGYVKAFSLNMFALILLLFCCDVVLTVCAKNQMPITQTLARSFGNGERRVILLLLSIVIAMIVISKVESDSLLGIKLCAALIPVIFMIVFTNKSHKNLFTAPEIPREIISEESKALILRANETIHKISAKRQAEKDRFLEFYKRERYKKKFLPQKDNIALAQEVKKVAFDRRLNFNKEGPRIRTPLFKPDVTLHSVKAKVLADKQHEQDRLHEEKTALQEAVFKQEMYAKVANYKESSSRMLLEQHKNEKKEDSILSSRKITDLQSKYGESKVFSIQKKHLSLMKKFARNRHAVVELHTDQLQELASLKPAVLDRDAALKRAVDAASLAERVFYAGEEARMNLGNAEVITRILNETDNLLLDYIKLCNVAEKSRRKYHLIPNKDIMSFIEALAYLALKDAPEKSELLVQMETAIIGEWLVRNKALTQYNALLKVIDGFHPLREKGNFALAWEAIEIILNKLNNFD